MSHLLISFFELPKSDVCENINTNRNTGIFDRVYNKTGKQVVCYIMKLYVSKFTSTSLK